MTPRFQRAHAPDEHVRQLLAIRHAVVPIDLVGAQRENQMGFLLRLRGPEREWTLTVETERAAPYRLDGIALTQTEPR